MAPPYIIEPLNREDISMPGSIGTTRSAKTFYVRNEPQVVVGQHMKNRAEEKLRVHLKMSDQTQSSRNRMTYNPLNAAIRGPGVC
jgi:hypothetical protein